MKGESEMVCKTLVNNMPGKPDGIEGKIQQARDLGITYGELMARGM